MNYSLLGDIVVAVALGLGAAILLRLLRKIGFGRNMRIWLLLADFTTGSFLIVISPIGSTEAITVKFHLSAAILQGFTSGKVLVHQGDAGNSIYLIKSGSVRVVVHVEGVEEKLVACLGPGDFFGEMSLLT